MRKQQGVVHGRGVGRLTGRQLTTIICVAIVSIVVIVPTAAMAAAGAFTSTTAGPAVKGTNSSTAGNATAVLGYADASGNASRFGVTGKATGSGGVGVEGTGAQSGVLSNGPLRVAAGKPFVCSACIGAADMSTGAKRASAWGHVSRDNSPVITQSSGNVSASRTSTGVVCITVNGVDLTKTVPTITPDDTIDATDGSNLTTVEYDGSCGTHAFRVVTFDYTLGTGSQSLFDEGFIFEVP